ncbi:GNAT family N-acetyltransferase [Chitinophaga japonensis]|uniref:Acetyltransferase (GNAT) family protein n=1 Tax=Chitinophaga japonensis TaxID=104662 RepID=A0A562TBS6_CHIJA|nr:GNAT family N-acetyltransferase [Chitinophaga japonensis]TWI91027.1 acetyltransferase (GNAT) family protein [Chitinophaga japonensis]
MTTLKRVNSGHPGFRKLIIELDKELWNIFGTVQAQYDQYNSIEQIDTVVLAYEQDTVVACGCFKQYDAQTVEIKRMFVVPGRRSAGVATLLLQELEAWARELQYQAAILETGKIMPAAVRLYEKNGYVVTENYGQYVGMEQSVCMRKRL